jgi:hypothetical protein
MFTSIQSISHILGQLIRVTSDDGLGDFSNAGCPNSRSDSRGMFLTLFHHMVLKLARFISSKAVSQSSLPRAAQRFGPWCI